MLNEYQLLNTSLDTVLWNNSTFWLWWQVDEQGTWGKKFAKYCFSVPTFCGTFLPRIFSIKKAGARYTFHWIDRSSLWLGSSVNAFLEKSTITHNLYSSLALACYIKPLSLYYIVAHSGIGRELKNRKSLIKNQRWFLQTSLLNCGL